MKYNSLRLYLCSVDSLCYWFLFLFL